jgi:HK97 family phage prohead protease
MNRLGCGFLEVKFNPGADDGTFAGYGSIFGNVDSYGDVVAPGAFKSTLQEAKSGTGAWPAMLLQHGGDSVEDKMPIGIWTAMDEDDNGLRMEGKLALDTRRGAEAYALLKMTPRPALNGLSIGYRARKFVMGAKTDKARRTLTGVDLHEVSLVTFPANTLATVTSVKASDEIKTIRDFENFLRDVGGFSNSAAKAIASGGFKSHADLRDEDDGEKRLADLLEKAAAIFNPK